MLLFNDNHQTSKSNKDESHFNFLFKGLLSFEIIEAEASSLNTTNSNFDPPSNLKRSISTESFNFYDIKKSLSQPDKVKSTPIQIHRRSMRSHKETSSDQAKPIKYSNLMIYNNVSFTLSKKPSRHQKTFFNSVNSHQTKPQQSKPISKHNTFKTFGGKNMYNNGRWTFDEHKRFVFAILNYGNEWKTVQEEIKSRTSTQSRSHSQKFFLKIRNINLNTINIQLTKEEIEKGVGIVYEKLNIVDLKELYDKLSKENRKLLLNYLLNIESNEEEDDENNHEYNSQDLKAVVSNKQVTFGIVNSQLNGKRKKSEYKEEKEKEKETKRSNKKEEKEEKHEYSMDFRMNINRKYSLRKDSELINLKPSFQVETDISYKDSVSNNKPLSNNENRKETLPLDEFSNHFNETFLNSRHRRKTSYYDDPVMFLYSNNTNNGKKTSMNGFRKSSTQTSQENFKVDSFFNDLNTM